jgi:lipoprotein-releasing system permease protein
LKFETFIARRIVATKSYKSSISAPIIKIAIAAISLGIVMMMISMATGVGLQQKIRQKIAAFHGQIAIATYDNNTSEVSVNPIQKDLIIESFPVQIEGVDHIQGVAKKAGIIKTKQSFEGIILKGVDNQYRWNTFEEYLIAGKIPAIQDSIASKEVLVSEFIANRLLLSVGDRFKTYFMKNDTTAVPSQRTFVVSGIYSSGFSEFDATYILGDIQHIRTMNQWEADTYGNYEVFITDFDSLENLTQTLYQQTPSTLDVQNISEKFYDIFSWLALFDMNILIIIVIMILVGGVNMITALLVLILERTQMIGVLTVLGSSQWSIRKVFLYNAAYLISIGLFWGNLIGLSLLYLQQASGIIGLDPNTYYVAEVPVDINFMSILMLNIGTLFFCMLMLLIPSYIITKIAPVKVLRFQ